MPLPVPILLLLRLLRLLFLLLRVLNLGRIVIGKPHRCSPMRYGSSRRVPVRRRVNRNQQRQDCLNRLHCPLLQTRPDVDVALEFGPATSVMPAPQEYANAPIAPFTMLTPKKLGRKT